MAFKLHSVSSARTIPAEYYTIASGETVVIGEALVLALGKLTKCGATATPEFIALAGGTGTTIPVGRVDEDMKLETAFSADGSALNVGDKVTLSTDGLNVTATTTSGVFTITDKVGSGATGTLVRGMFRR